MTQVKISVPTFVSEPNCIGVNPLCGKALYEQVSAGLFEDFLEDAQLTQDEKALTVSKGDRKVLIVHAVQAIINEKTLASTLQLAFKVDTELWALFQERCPDLAVL